VVDDGSRQPVQQALHGLTTPYALRVERQDNAGAAAARDRGVRLARAPVVVITDDDMRVGPDFLLRHLEAHRAGATVVLGHIASSDNLDKMPVFERFHAAQLERFVRGVRTGRVSVHGVHVCTGNLSFRREDYLTLGGFDAKLKRSEDRELGVRLEKHGARLTFAEGAITRHESDHTDLDVWLRRCFLYGVYDRKIAAKHPDVEMADPWRFFFLVSPLSRPLLLTAVLLPEPMQHATTFVVRAAARLDAAGQQRLAVKATTLAYGLEYFRGMRAEAGSLRACAQDFVGYFGKRLRARRGKAEGR
jgi:GT2 family glycosyltransferase